MTLTKADLAKELSDKLQLTKKDALSLVDSIFLTMEEALYEGKSVKISGFGNFELRNKKARLGRNPKTGEEFPIKARRVVTFKPGQKLKTIVSKNVSVIKNGA